MERNNKYIETAWNEYSKKLLAFIRTKIKSHEDSKDILAAVFLKLAKQVELSGIPHKLSNWLYFVTRNSIVDYYRTKKTLEKLPEDLRQDQPDPQAISALSACIMPIIEELPDTYRLPIIRSEIDGKTQREVAAELNLSLPAVKSRIFRGRKKLKNLMAKRCMLYYDEYGQLFDYNEKNNICGDNSKK
jgi:RNA polymerase sigma-70 factor (ECF subfamily)